MPRRASLPAWSIVVAAAAALGVVAGVLTSVTDDGPQASPRAPASAAPAPAAEAAPEAAAAPGVRAPPRDVETVRERVAGSASSLAERFDSDEPDVRFATAYELLERGPGALAQVTALRPKGREANELRLRLEKVLRDRAVILRSATYRRGSDEARLYSKLHHYERVLPPEWLRRERLAYWHAKVAGDEARAADGRARPAGESALARLELALVRYELGKLTRTEFIALREADEGAARAWVRGLRVDRGVSSAERRRRELQLARITR